MNEMEFTIGTKGENKEQKVKGELFQKETQVLLESGLKEWDFDMGGQPAPITWENIQKLSKKDGDYLRNEIAKLGLDEIPATTKKK